MFDIDFEKFIAEGIRKVEQVIRECLQPGELYSLKDILTLLGVQDVESQDFFHVVLHCHSSIDTVYQVECKKCGHLTLIKSMNHAAVSVCPFCHNKDLEVTELFRIQTPITQVIGDHKCTFCGRRVKIGFIGKENKVICWSCVRKFKHLQDSLKEGKGEKGKRP